MKTKKLFTILFLFILIFSNSYFVFAVDSSANLDISAQAVYFIDNRTNKVLYSKNEDKRMYPASTTKILTAILVLESASLDEVTTASYNAIMSVPDGYSIANIQVGEELTIEQLLEMLLVHSANDAANVLAEYVGGSIDSFVSMMNTKLNDLGLTSSHFSNAYGLHDENHYTTAKDLAFLMQYCLKNDTFRKISGQASCAIPATNMSNPRTYSSTNELLNANSSNYYPYLTAGKTGFTSNAKECLISCAYRDDLEIIGCVLGSDNRFYDTKVVYEFLYNNYSIKNIANVNDIITTIEVENATSATKKLDLLISETIPALLPSSYDLTNLEPEITLNDNISAPVSEGDILGRVSYNVDGVSYSTNLIASNAVEKTKVPIYIFYACVILLLVFLFNKIFLKNKRKTNRKALTCVFYTIGKEYFLIV